MSPTRRNMEAPEALPCGMDPAERWGARLAPSFVARAWARPWIQAARRKDDRSRTVKYGVGSPDK